MNDVSVIARRYQDRPWAMWLAFQDLPEAAAIILI
jgi:hypothetical protein